MNKVLYFIATVFVIVNCIKNPALALTFVAEDLPPYHYKNEQGEVVGALVDLSKAVLNKAQLDGTFEIMPMARAYHRFETHSDIIMMSLLKNPKRLELFDWIGAVYFADAYLISLDTFKGKVDNLEQAKEYRVGTINGYSSEQYLRDAGFSDNENLVLVSHYTQLWQMLFKQRLDFVLTNTLTLKNELKLAGFDVSQVKKQVHLNDYPATLYFAANKKLDKQTSLQLKQALLKVKETGEYQEILAKWQLPMNSL
ncbi:amino acid ABC transporter substrate-binding protein [Pseudoalteromonas sp. KS88]|uniref:substrate-binding periplasmic protein n=1 Tax=Pseudoalteromonas sp. KS88 TaxID=2109918 RepID=UPI00107FF83F|nr:transporter substrate-binding domain-containing protein [Pseudoalteromonas sp. KS88]TGE85516.1 amino acid ABC transporter substrate-binding protein [Pseudoalteromonas sp. KS88]